MKEQLEAVLRNRLSSRIQELSVDLQNDRIVLRGWTRSYYFKQLAQEIVTQVSGISVSANDIEVR